jgi:hypothetical protein
MRSFPAETPGEATPREFPQGIDLSGLEHPCYGSPAFLRRTAASMGKNTIFGCSGESHYLFRPGATKGGSLVRSRPWSQDSSLRTDRPEGL